LRRTAIALGSGTYCRKSKTVNEKRRARARRWRRARLDTMPGYADVKCAQKSIEPVVDDLPGRGSALRRLLREAPCDA
jgi:hypothetical protein